MSTIESILANELRATPQQVWAAIRLLDGGATVPFIARYRKEATGGLTDTHLRMLEERLESLRDLEKRRLEVLHAIEDQGKLTESLKSVITRCDTKQALEDIYLPFKPKKNSKSQAARDLGLEPLLDAILKDPASSPDVLAAPFVSPDKNVATAAEALVGAREIFIDRILEHPELPGKLRDKFWSEGWVISKKKALTLVTPEDAEKFSDYFNFREAFAKIPSHRMLAILRGRKENVLDVTFATGGFADYDDHKKDPDAEYVFTICRYFGVEPKKRPGDNWLWESARTAWKYRMRLRIEVDVLMRLRERAEEEAIRVFAGNLRDLLLAAPAGSRVTMGLDPGFRTGVKVAVVGKAGQVLETAVIYPHPPDNKIDASLKTLKEICERHKVELIAIGNGTASRETDKLAAELIRRNPDLKLQKLVVSEAGASVYSASELASKELPAMDVTLRGAVSIARRLQDPLAELVKIDPKSIGVGQYQHDVNPARLGRSLRAVVEDCVNAVGVDVNTASEQLLSYVSGLSAQAARNLVAHRSEKGLFKNRIEFLSLPEFGPKTFEQAAGFLRIREGENPLDGSGVHPESYPVVEKILSQNQKSLTAVIGNAEFLETLSPDDYSDEKFGAVTVEDILTELEKPGRDPRPEFKTAGFREDVSRMEDLKPGMTLEGVVTNVANFGAFVDIGVHQDGLVHVSEMSDRFVTDPRTVVKTGQVVRVRVVEVDLPRKRIALSMKAQKNSAQSRV